MTYAVVFTLAVEMAHQPMQDLDERTLGGNDIRFKTFQGIGGAGERILDAKEVQNSMVISNQAVVVDHPGIRKSRLWFVNQSDVTVNHQNSNFREDFLSGFDHCILHANVASNGLFAAFVMPPFETDFFVARRIIQ